MVQLYDASGNLLGTNDNGAADGKNAKLTYRVAATGAYYVRVLGVNGSAGEYTLSVKGATGALPAFTVTGTNPPAGKHVRPITSITVDFSDSVLLSSLATANVTFGGKAATGYTVDNDHEVTWYLQGVPPGDDLPFVFQIPAGAVKNIHGVGLTGFKETIFVDTVAPRVTASSVHEGNVLKTGSLTYKVTFSEPIDTSSFSASSFDLHGVYRNADYAAASFTFDATGKVLTITFANLPDDAYKLTLFSAGIHDITGYALDGEPNATFPSGDGKEGGDFFVDFSLDDPTIAFPAALTAVNPHGSLIYQGTATEVIAPGGESDAFTLKLAKNQTLTLDLTGSAGLQAAVALYDSAGNLIDSSTATAAGGEVLLQTDRIVNAGTYKIVVTGANSTAGLYNLQVTLNAALDAEVHGGPSNDTPGTAQSIDGSFLNLGGTASRGAVLGSINQAVVSPGDVFVSTRGGGVQLVHNGAVVATFNDPSLNSGVVQDVELGPNGDVYVGVDTAPGTGAGGEVLHFSPAGVLLGTVKLPADSAGNFFYPFGFDVASDGTIWVAAPNSGEIIHAAADGTLIRAYVVGGQPEWVAVRPSDGAVFYTDDHSSAVDVLDPSAGTVTTFASDPYGLPFGLTFTPGGNLLVADPNAGVLEFDGSGNTVLTVFDFGALDTQADPSGNIDVANADFGTLDQFDSNGNFLNSTSISGTPIGVAVVGVDGPAPPPPDLTDYYSFKLDAGQTATVVLTDVGGAGAADEALTDANGNVLASGAPGGSNYNETLSYTASMAGTYYVRVTGNHVEYSVVVTKNAAFDAEPNNTQGSAQALPSSGTALGAVFNPGNVAVGTQFQGLEFTDSAAQVYPPDTIAAVGSGYVMETINEVLRITDTAGNNLLTAQISDFLGLPSGTSVSDPYVVYDDIANRFVFEIVSFNAQGGTDVQFAISKDSNPLDGFYVNSISLGANLLDFAKLGYNADAYVITGNLFGAPGTPLQGISIDKSSVLGGGFTYYEWQRDGSHFRAEVPATMHGATPGGPMYLVEEAGYGNGHAARVVTMTNVLSSSPTFVDTDIAVNAYGFPPSAAQPGDFVATNDTTFTKADWRNGMLVSAQSVSEPDDGFSTSRVRWYEFSTTGAVPTLVQQGSIHPGPGVSTYFGTVAINAAGDIGVTYMESSSTEYVSMYVTGRRASDPLGTLHPATDVAPGIGTRNFGRAGDYSGIGVDPSDGMTFWAANEYAGTDFLYNTYIASFTVPPPVDPDWYSFAANGGDKLTVTVTLPGSAAGSQFADTLSPVVQLFDGLGNLLASGTTKLTYTVPKGAAGTYFVEVTGAAATQGEYVLRVQGATGGAGPTFVSPTPAPAVLTAAGTAGGVARDAAFSGLPSRSALPATAWQGAATQGVSDAAASLILARLGEGAFGGSLASPAGAAGTSPGQAGQGLGVAGIAPAPATLHAVDTIFTLLAEGQANRPGDALLTAGGLFAEEKTSATEA
jgi:hypothetical protein